jgi:hypothetical protein
MVQEKFEEKNLAVCQNTQAAGFYAQSGCEPAIYGASHARINLTAAVINLFLFFTLQELQAK